MSLNQRILNATKGLDGWCEPNKQLTLAHYVLAIQARMIVEIGVWGGKSLIPLAMAAQHTAPARVLAIDPWKAHESVKGQDGEDLKWWNNQAQHDLVFDRFMLSLRTLELTGIVTVLRQSSNETLPPPTIDLLHVDGNHGPQALQDVQRFAPSIRTGGICVLDDLNWSGGAVGKAAQRLKQNGFLELHTLGTGAVYLRV